MVDWFWPASCGLVAGAVIASLSLVSTIVDRDARVTAVAYLNAQGLTDVALDPVRPGDEPWCAKANYCFRYTAKYRNGDRSAGLLSTSYKPKVSANEGRIVGVWTQRGAP